MTLHISTGNERVFENAYTGLQWAAENARARVTSGQGEQSAAMQAAWDGCKKAFCWGEGHKNRPRAGRHWSRKSWLCDRCGTRLVSVSSEWGGWLWRQVDRDLWRLHGDSILDSPVTRDWPEDFAL